MSQPMRSPHAADRNLLFGVLALQLDFVTRDGLVRGMSAWALDKGRPLAEILVEQGALAADARALLEPLVEQHVRAHGGDPHRSLAAISSVGSVRDDLRLVADADVQASLAHLATDPHATRDPTAGPPVGSGGRFRVLVFHGEGGQGEVFKAHDAELNRQVALKQIKKHYADNPEIRARFLREAEITGGLEHPGIVPVYGLGHYPDGRPFYAMRFVRGDSLQKAVERFHGADTATRDPGERAMALRQLLGRFIDVCNAIQYAHDRGVLHRDLKPGNVMLGPYGETLVVDWGLAKVADRPDSAGGAEAPLQPASGGSETLPGSAVGTPQFMPPEQAEGRLDRLGPASDVYSLGATLYAVLTGRAPFPPLLDPRRPQPDARSLPEILELVREGRVPPPREVKPDVDRALAAICLKAMRPRPEDRYASPRELADEVERWLADEPVRAYPEPLTRRARRWLGRHRTAVAALAAAGGVAAAGLGTGLWLLGAADQRERDARAAAAGEHERAEREQARAQRSFQLAVAAGDDAGALAEAVKPLAGTQSATVERVLQLAMTNYDRLLAEAGPSPELKGRKARLLTDVSELYIELGNTDRALATAKEARRLYEELLEQDPDNTTGQAGLGTSLERLGVAEGWRGDQFAALGTFRQSLQVREKVLAKEPDNPRWRAAVARGHTQIGNVLQLQDDLPGARAAYQQAFDLRRRLAGEQPGDRQTQGDFALACVKLAQMSYYLDEDYPAALNWYSKAEGIYRELARDDGRTAKWKDNLAGVLLDRGYTHAELGQTGKALACYREAISIAERQARLDPLNQLRQMQLHQARNYLAQLRKTADPVSAVREQLDVSTELLKLSEARHRQDPGNASWQADLAGNKGTIALDLIGLVDYGALPASELARAQKLIEESIALVEPLTRRDPTNARFMRRLALDHVHLARIAALEGHQAKYRREVIRQNEITVAFYRAQVAREPENPAWHGGLAKALAELASNHARAGDWPAALTEYREALATDDDLLRREPDNTHWLKQKADALAHLAGSHIGRATPAARQGSAFSAPIGWALERQERSEALVARRREVEVLEELVRRDSAKPAWSRALSERYRDLAALLSISGDRAGEEATFRQSLDVLERLYAANPAEGQRDPFARDDEPALTSNAAFGELIDLHNGRRGTILLMEESYRIRPTLRKVQELIEVYTALVNALDLSQPGNVREARWALRRGLGILRRHDAAGELHPVQKRLIPFFAAALSRLPPDPDYPAVEEQLRGPLLEMDYRQLMVLLFRANRTRDLVLLLAREAEAAERIQSFRDEARVGRLVGLAWAGPLPSLPLLGLRWEQPKVPWVRQLVEELVVGTLAPHKELAGRLLEAAGEVLRADPEALGPAGRRLFATLARRAGDAGKERVFAPGGK